MLTPAVEPIIRGGWGDSNKCPKEQAAEKLREEILFRQPDSSHLGDCPICFLPHPIDQNKTKTLTCCCITICNGCTITHITRMREQRIEWTCPFCRKPQAKTDEGLVTNYRDRAEANDAVALHKLGLNYYHKKHDYESSFYYFTRAAELGDAMGHYCLSVLYKVGKGVAKDLEKERYHWEEAAIAGHPDARYNLANYEWRRNRFDRAVKHFIIGANLGHDDSMDALKSFYREGHISKDDFAVALRAHHGAKVAAKSPQREKAEEVLCNM